MTWKRTILAELQGQNLSWKEAKQMAKNRVCWQKFVMAVMFHLGITGNDDDNIYKVMKEWEENMSMTKGIQLNSKITIKKLFMQMTKQ
jgi:hypothetical protein